MVPGPFPLSVKPDQEGIIIFDKLPELIFHKSDVLVHLRHCGRIQLLFLSEGIVRCRIVHRIIIPIPVANGIISPESNALFFTLFSQFLQDPFAIGGSRHIVFCIFTVPKAESIVMPAGDDQILHSGGSGQTYPLSGIKQLRVEFGIELIILTFGNFPAP